VRGQAQQAGELVVVGALVVDNWGCVGLPYLDDEAAGCGLFEGLDASTTASWCSSC
jgi:hypothetical protein